MVAWNKEREETRIKDLARARERLGSQLIVWRVAGEACAGERLGFFVQPNKFILAHAFANWNWNWNRKRKRKRIGRWEWNGKDEIEGWGWMGPLMLTNDNTTQKESVATRSSSDSEVPPQHPAHCCLMRLFALYFFFYYLHMNENKFNIN